MQRDKESVFDLLDVRFGSKADTQALKLNVCFGSKAVTQMPEKFQIAGFRAQDASSNVRFRPKADITVFGNLAILTVDLANPID